MTDIEFLPYHNRHIMFKLNTGVELSGVLVDTMRHRNVDNGRNMYEFIATSNMIEYKQAESVGDIERMNKLKGEVDLDDVVWVQLHTH